MLLLQLGRVIEYCCCFSILFIFNFVFRSCCVLLALCFCWLCFRLYLLLFILGQCFCCFLLLILIHIVSFEYISDAIHKLDLKDPSAFSLILSVGSTSVFVISSAGSYVAVSFWVRASSAFSTAAAFFSFWKTFSSILSLRSFIFLDRNLLYCIFSFFFLFVF